jgi:hypothetical protein
VSGVGGVVLKAEPAAFGRIRAEIRHSCGHSQTLIVRDRDQAVRSAKRVCEACAPPAEEVPPST